jgi:hypothetical protein
VLVLNRKFITYLAETLDFLAKKLEKDEKYVAISYLLYKMFVAIEKELVRASPYWEHLRMPNTNEEWDGFLLGEVEIMRPFGEALKMILMASGVSLPMRLEFETHYIDFKYYIHLLSEFMGENEVRVKLINCLLINRHYVLAIEKKVIDLTDYIESKKLLEEKEELCKKFAFTRS